MGRNPMRQLAVTTIVAGCVVLTTATAGAAATCDDRLFTHPPDGSSGDPATVAVTSQTLERGTPGWTQVTWTAGPGTTVRTVLVEHAVSAQRTVPVVSPSADVGSSAPALAGVPVGIVLAAVVVLLSRADDRGVMSR